MKLAILCNFGPYPTVGGSVGGSEAVIAEIAEGLTKRYGFQVDIYGHNYSNISSYNGINLFPCPKGDSIVDKISNNYSHVFIYSDSQWNINNIIHNIKSINCKISLCLVGAYHMQSHPEILELLKKNIDRFSLITHSKTSDYEWCKKNNLPVRIIPNGVNLQEFKENKIDFREKYSIKEKYIINSTNNFFFGKGFEILPKIYKKLFNNLDDFIISSVSNSVKYPYDKIFLNRTKNQCKGMNIRFLRDLPREDVVAAFQQSDILMSCSKKEVAPLVILESRASKLPWISMDVGNVKEVSGGIVISNNNIDHKGYKIVDDKVIDSYASNIIDLLTNKELRQSVIDDGQKNIEKLDWSNIVPLYNEVFRG